MSGTAVKTTAEKLGELLGAIHTKVQATCCSRDDGGRERREGGREMGETDRQTDRQEEREARQKEK